MGVRRWRELLEQALKGRVEAWEVFWARTRRLGAVARGQEEFRRVRAISEGIGLRVIVEGRVGFSFAAGPPLEDSAARIAELAVAGAMAGGVEEGFSFAPPPSALPEPQPIDKAIVSLEHKSLAEMALELARAAIAADEKVVQVYPAHVETSVSEVVVLNSHGLELSREEAAITAFLEVVASDGRAQESAWDVAAARRLEQLDLPGLGSCVAREAVSQLGASPVGDGVYDVIFHPRAAGGLVELVAQSLRGDNMLKGRSMLLGKQGQKVFSELVSITDDPFAPGGVIHRVFDDEGSPCSRLLMVDRGRVARLAYDRLWAARAGLSSTGSCIRPATSSPPGVGFTNLMLEPGEAGEIEDMAQDMGKGLVITQLMGLHTADPISGRLSVGASGYLVEGGQITRAVRSIAIAGELKELFARVRGVGSQVVFRGTVGAAAVAVEGVSVSGP